MTQTISYREGKHFGTLSIDMDDPEDAIFIEQFKRVPSKNRDYIAALYAREKRRGVNRHIGDHIQPLSLVKQIDEPDVQKSRLTIDKNSLMETLKRIDEKVQEIRAEIANGERTQEDAEIELKSLAAEREKIKARADELGIKIAALSTKSSADGSSPLKPDQLLTIIKKLQEQGTAPDLTPILNKIENLRLDKGGGLMPYISALIDIIDKTFVYESGKSLELSKVKDGLESLNMALTGKRITGNKTATERKISNALNTIMKIYNTQGGYVTVRAGIEMEAGVAAALFKRLFTSLMLAIDFDFKDIDFSKIDSEFIDRDAVMRYIREIRNAIEESTHMYTGFKQLEVPEEKVNLYTEIAKNIVNYLNSAAVTITRAGNSRVLNICAVLLGIKSATNVDSFPTVYRIRENLIKAYENNDDRKFVPDKKDPAIKDAYDAFKGINQQKNYTMPTIATAFNAIKDMMTQLTANLAAMQETIPVSYNRVNNTLIIDKMSIDEAFSYTKQDASKNQILNDITENAIIERLKRQHFPKNIHRSPEIVERAMQRSNATVDTDGLNTGEEGTEAWDMSFMNEQEREQYEKDKRYQAWKQDAMSSEEFMDRLISEEYALETKKGRFGESYTDKIIRKQQQGKGIAGYVKIIDRGNPLKRW